jgi:hypothetical protein
VNEFIILVRNFQVNVHLEDLEVVGEDYINSILRVVGYEDGR